MYDNNSLFRVLNAIEDGIYIINQDYTVEYMNKAMVKLFGEGVGRKCYRLINCSNRTCSWCRAYETFSGKQVSMEVDVPTVGKTFQVLSMPLKNSDGTVSKLSVYRDISLRKQQEAKLKSTEADYRRLFENVNCGVCNFSISLGRLYFATIHRIPAFARMTGSYIQMSFPRRRESIAFARTF